MKKDLISLLHDVKRLHLWFIAVVLATLLTLPIVSVIEFSLEGKVTSNYLITGFIASIIVASVISGLIIYFLQFITKLKQNNEQLNVIINSCPVPMAINNSKGTILSINPEFIKRFGYQLTDIPTLDDWWPKAYPDEKYRQWVMDSWNERLENFLHNNSEFKPLEIKICCKDDTCKTVLATATPLGNAVEGIFLVVLYDLSEKAKMVDALNESRNILQSIIETIPMRVFWKDKNSRYLGANTAFAKDAGENDPSNIIGKLDQDLAWKEQAELYQSDDREVIRSCKPKIAFEEPQTTPAGDRIVLRTSKVPLYDDSNAVIGVLGVYEDITKRKKIDAELRVAATAFESQEGMIITDANTNILKVNHSFTRITGFTSEEALGRKMNLLKSGVHSADFYRDMWDSIKTTDSWQGEVWNRRKNGEIYPEWLTVTAVKDDEGDTTHYVGTMIDITARKAIEERIHHMAHYDVLTDLPNRALLTDRLHQAIAQTRREKSKLALIFLDLDNFKPVNDSLGHDIGDLLLKEVARRLHHCVKRETDTLSRIGGDEFVIILSQIEKDQDAAIVADKIVQALTEPFNIEQHTIHISCSIGIAINPLHGADVNTLMRVADNAMYEAKRAGRGCFRFYTSDSPQSQLPI